MWRITQQKMFFYCLLIFLPVHSDGWCFIPWTSAWPGWGDGIEKGLKAYCKFCESEGKGCFPKHLRYDAYKENLVNLYVREGKKTGARIFVSGFDGCADLHSSARIFAKNITSSITKGNETETCLVRLEVYDDQILATDTAKLKNQIMKQNPKFACSSFTEGRGWYYQHLRLYCGFYT